MQRQQLAEGWGRRCLLEKESVKSLEIYRLVPSFKVAHLSSPHEKIDLKGWGIAADKRPIGSV
jgi:hypothetical protein